MPSCLSGRCFGHVDLLQGALQKKLLTTDRRSNLHVTGDTRNESRVLLARLRHDHQPEHLLQGSS